MLSYYDKTFDVVKMSKYAKIKFSYAILGVYILKNRLRSSAIFKVSSKVF